MSLRAIWRNLKDFALYLPVSVWFNFYHLPLKQAFRLPILLRAPRLSCCAGSVRIEAERIRPGMIRLGGRGTGVFSRPQFLWENRGRVVFRGTCRIGSNSLVSVGERGVLTIGNNFTAGTSLELICYHRISFGENTLVGWDNVFCDTDFHRTRSESPSSGYAPIEIGDENWFGMKCIVLKGTRTPNRCIVGAGAVLAKDYSSLPEKCLLAGNPAMLKKTDIYMDRNDDRIHYSTYES